MDIMPMRSITVAWNCTEEEGEVKVMTTSREHYEQYFRADPIDWHSYGITHEQLLEDSFLRFEEGISLMTDSQLGAKIRQVKEEGAIEDGAEYCFYKPDWTAKELGAVWRQEYQDSWYSC